MKSVKAGVTRGYQMVMADGGSSTAFLGEIARFPTVTFVRRQEQERGAGRRQGFQVATALEGVRAILRTEPEKVSVVEEFVPKIALPLLNGEADIVVPRRNPALHLSTYPRYQVESEIAANKKYNNLLHKTGLLPQDQFLDIFFGPVAFRNDPSTLELFMEKYDFTLPASIGIRKYAHPENWSDGYFFSVVKALHQGLRVISIDVDFRYPDLQRRTEETVDKGAVDRFIAKRAQQKWGLLDELVHFIRFLHSDTKSGLRMVDSSV